MKTALLILVGIALAATNIQARLPQLSEPGGREAQLKALHEIEAHIDTIFLQKDGPDLTILGQYLRKFGRQNNFQIPEREEALERLSNRIMLVPGYVDFYLNEFLVYTEKNKLDGITLSLMQRKRLFATQTLELLPSYETALAMSKLLDDYAPIVASNSPDTSAPGNSYAARRVLAAIIATPPREEGEYLWPQDWFDWRDDVRDGKLSFKVKGDPQWYNFDGPVESPTQAQRSNSRPSTSPTLGLKAQTLPSEKNPTNSSKKQHKIGVALALTLVATALLTFLLRKKIWRVSA